MTEKMNPNRIGKRIAIGMAGLAIAGTAVAEANAADESRHPANARILMLGQSVSQIPMLSPNHHKDSTTRLTPISKHDTEDLAVIYDSRKSGELAFEAGNPLPGDNVGIVVSSAAGKTALELVFFDPEFRVIDGISDPSSVAQSEIIYGYRSLKDPTQSYVMSVTPQFKTGGATVSFTHTDERSPDLSEGLLS